MALMGAGFPPVKLAFPHAALLARIPDLAGENREGSPRILHRAARFMFNSLFEPVSYPLTQSKGKALGISGM